MDAASRFATLLARPEPEVPLDEAAALVAAHVRPGLDPAGEVARLDVLAAECWARTLDDLLRYLFQDLGFCGNRIDYHDPRNSLIDRVLDRRVGIPITLAVVVLEVGRRVGVPLVPVGMPGHFLLRDRVDDAVFVDPFAGTVIDRDGCERLLRSVHGPTASLRPEHLEETGRYDVVARLLANLKLVYAQRREMDALARVLQLRQVVPGVPFAEREELVRALTGAGRFRAAADELDRLAAVTTAEVAEKLRHSATRLRARLN